MPLLHSATREFVVFCSDKNGYSVVSERSYHRAINEIRRLPQSIEEKAVLLQFAMAVIDFATGCHNLQL